MKTIDRFKLPPVVVGQAQEGIHVVGVELWPQFKDDRPGVVDLVQGGDDVHPIHGAYARRTVNVVDGVDRGEPAEVVVEMGFDEAGTGAADHVAGAQT